LPNEGKTTLAIGLALSAAEAGQRAIVVDLDLRRPSVAWQLGETATGGVVEVASGEQVLADAVGLSRLSSRLHFLGVKRRVATPSELLTSDVLGVLVSDLRRRYDFVVLDSPPALGLVDARIASQLADAVLYVVRWGHTSAEAAALGLEGLRTSRIPVQGVVLAQVDLHRHRRYGLGDAGKYYDQYRKYFVN
jgi:Mrp family chromosome partitioning ATPase